jgi:hypothetical protein
MDALDIPTFIRRPELLKASSSPLAPAVLPPPPTRVANSWDAVRTTDLTALAQRVINEDLGPGVPITPVHPEKTEPRLFDYTPGYNIAITPRTFEDLTFATLRGLARSWDVAALCIQRNIDDLRQLHWEMRPKAVPGMDRGAVRDRKRRLEATRAEAEGFWYTPDQEHSWSGWVAMYFKDLYEVDASTIYLRKRLDGTLYAAQLVDGTTIAPLVDERGRPPVPPEPAYRQIIRGMPWTMYANDLQLPPDERKLSFDKMQMVYEPFWPRTDSPYGHPPMEWVILTVQRALARQVLDFRLFNDGTTSYDYWKMPSDWTEGQISSLQAAYDKLMSLPIKRAGLRFMPGGQNSGIEHGFMEPKTEGEEFLLHVGCAAFNRSPMEMGFIRSSGGAGLGGKSVAQEQGKAANKGVRAAAFHLKGIVDRITARYFSDELELVFPELEDVEDAELRAKAEDIRLRNGSVSIDEVRLDRDMDPIGPADKPGNMIYLGTNPPVSALDAIEGQLAPAMPAGGNPPSPTAVPGQATSETPVSKVWDHLPDLESFAKALGGKRLDFKGDLATVVHRYLLRSYPAKDVEWVLDPSVHWSYEPTVKLSDINMARRPGGRNEEKVNSIASIVEDGASLDPLVLVDAGDPAGYTIADGYHRTLGVEHAGKDAVPAFIATGVDPEMVRTISGPMQADSASIQKADLARWRRKSLASLRRGRGAAVPFASEAIPPATVTALSAALAVAPTPTAVRAVFDVLGD